MKIYTKTGDKGETALYGGERVSKAALRVSAYGTVDETNSSIGLARAQLADTELDSILATLQHALFDLGADLATPQSVYRRKISAIDEQDVSLLEAYIDRFEAELEPLQQFILPAGHVAAASLHVARSIARRAEREVISLSKQEAVNAHVIIYLNRLSDLLFVLARVVNQRAGLSESQWHAKGRKRAQE